MSSKISDRPAHPVRTPIPLQSWNDRVIYSKSLNIWILHSYLNKQNFLDQQNKDRNDRSRSHKNKTNI